MDSFHGPRSSDIPSLLTAPSKFFFTSGRYGLARALQLAGVSDEDEVLIPGYSCPAMVEPVIWLGAKPVFYKVTESLSADLVDLTARLSPATKCLVIVHFFGFLQDLRSIRNFCDAKQIQLIEDCAQCFFGGSSDQPVGSYGDLAFGSPMKFFPIYDGGCLVSNTPGMDLTLQRAGVPFQLRSCLDTVERAHHYQRLPFRLLLDSAFKIKRSIRELAGIVFEQQGQSAAPAATEGGYAFQDSWKDIQMSHFSRWVMNHVSQARLVEQRRINYLQLLEQLKVPGGCWPIFPELTESTVPYIFPLYVDDCENVFPRLKKLGVPLLRWEDAETTTCAVSKRYSRHLFLIPCHQELNPRDIEWITTEIIRSING